MTYFYAITDSSFGLAMSSIIRAESEQAIRQAIAWKSKRGYRTRQCDESTVEKVVEAKRQQPEIFSHNPAWVRDVRLDGSPLPWEYLSCF